MEKRLLLTTQRNEIFDCITNLGLNPIDFDFMEVRSGFVPNCIVTKIISKITGYYFTIDFDDQYHVRYITYYPSADGTKIACNRGEWAQIIVDVQLWLITIKKETSIEDLWQSILAEKIIFNKMSSQDLTNDLIMQHERDNISAELNKLKVAIIETYGLVDETRQFIEEQFDYLDESQKRLGRKDWIHIAIAVSFNIASSLPPETAKTIWTILLSFLSRFLGGGTYLPL